MRLIDADALLKELSDDTAFSILLRDIIEEQPAMICKTIEDKMVIPLGTPDIMVYMRDDYRKMLAEGIASCMLENGLITFEEHNDGDYCKMKAVAKVIKQIEKEDTK